MKPDVTDYADLPVTLTVEHVAMVLRIGITKARNLTHSQGFPRIKYGRQIVIPKQQFIDWLDSQVQRGE